MNVEAANPGGESALSTLVNVLIAPQSAFASIRERPRWLVAFVVVSVLAMIASYLEIPAVMHAMTIWYPAQLAKDPSTASLSPDRASQMLNLSLGFVRYQWLASPLVVVLTALFAALVLLIVSAIAKGDGGFGRLFSLAMNVGVVVFGIGYLVTALIVVARGPDGFASPVEVSGAVPSLAWLAPAAPPKLQTLLSSFNPFTIWSFVLLALGTSTVARVSRGAAWAASAAVTLTGVLLSVALAK
jgi:membrane protein, antimicrobial resistance system